MSHKPRIAVLSTEYHPSSHTDVIVSRWLQPFPTDTLYGWKQPNSEIASFYVAQKSVVADLTSAVCLRYGIPCWNTIREALTLGGDRLAVDAVFLIAEHGQYPENELHQKLYPRKEFFDEMVAVFRESNRVVPVFFDKHLSWKPEWIEEMARTIQELGIPFFAGSSAPYSLPPSLQEIPAHLEFEEVVAVYFNALESYLFHSAECVEILIENRSESAKLESITAWQDDDVWQALDRGEFSWGLLEAACASAGSPSLQAIREHREKRGRPVYAFKLCYESGLKVTHFMQRDIVRKFCVGLQARGESAPRSGTILSAGIEHYYPHFARMCTEIEPFIHSRKSPVPLRRTYTTSMVTALSMQALAQAGQPLQVGPMLFSGSSPA